LSSGVLYSRNSTTVACNGRVIARVISNAMVQPIAMASASNTMTRWRAPFAVALAASRARSASELLKSSSKD
jgi:hypothetical protein